MSAGVNKWLNLCAQYRMVDVVAYPQRADIKARKHQLSSCIAQQVNCFSLLYFSNPGLIHQCGLQKCRTLWNLAFFHRLLWESAAFVWLSSTATPWSLKTLWKVLDSAGIYSSWFQFVSSPKEIAIRNWQRCQNFRNIRCLHALPNKSTAFLCCTFQSLDSSTNSAFRNAELFGIESLNSKIGVSLSGISRHHQSACQRINSHERWCQ